MRKRHFYCRIPMDAKYLQFFADPGDGGGAGGDPAGGTGETGGDPKPQSFDDFLRGEGNQAEFDRRVKEAVDKAVGDAQEKWRLMTDDKLSEAEKLSKMTKEEKERYLHRKKEKELADREATLTRKELMAEAKNTLAEKKLPVELAEVLVYTDADSCGKSIATVEKAFQTAVEAAVQERLKGGVPPKKASQETQVTKEEYAKMGYAERLRLKTEHPELYKRLTGI